MYKPEPYDEIAKKGHDIGVAAAPSESTGHVLFGIKNVHFGVGGVGTFEKILDRRSHDLVVLGRDVKVSVILTSCGQQREMRQIKRMRGGVFWEGDGNERPLG